MRLRIKGILTALVVLCAFCLYAPYVEASVAANTDFQVGAKAAIVMEAATGRVLFAQNEHEQLSIASTTKILTSLIALEQPDIDAVFKADPVAIKVEGSSMGLQEGDSVSLRALAVGMLLASGNDGANAAAVRIAGSIPAFASLMNKRASEIGMTNSSFETPSGLDGENHYSTAYDMALLAREALKNDLFQSICSQYKLKASYGDPPYDRWLTNHNKLLNYYEGAIGVKTGFTKKAGRCLVSAVKKDGVTLICVTLNCSDDWSVHQGLYDRFFPDIKLTDLALDIPKTTVPVTGGTEDSVIAVNYDAPFVPVSAGSEIEYKVSVQPFLYAPVKAGQFVGETEIFLNGEKVATLTLVAQAEVPAKYEYKEEKSFTQWLVELFSRK